MHPLFASPAVLSRVLTHVDDDSLAAYATVSRPFHEAALAVVWREATPRKIWRLFPDGYLDMGSEDTLVLPVPIDGATWDRVQQRTKHVRVFTYGREPKGAPDCLLALLLFRRSLPVFPRLLEVNFQIQSVDELRVMCLLISDELRVLRCTMCIYDLVDEIQEPTSLMQLVAALRETSSLDRVDFHFFLPPGDDTADDYLEYSAPLFALLDRFLVGFLADCPALKELSLKDVPYTATLFKYIACLPNLQEFDWKLQSPLDTIRSRRLPVTLSDLEIDDITPFPSLRSWYLDLNLDEVVDAYPNDGFIAAFIDLTAYSPIRSIVLSWVASKEYVRDVVGSIALTWPALRDVTLSITPPLDDGLVHTHRSLGQVAADANTSQAWDRWTLQTFRPLLMCKNLQIVNLHVHLNYSFAFTDKDLSEMKAWPQLRSLSIMHANDPCKCQQLQVTVMGLIALLLACPSLREVSMEIDLNPAVHPNLLQVWTTNLANSQLHHLRIGNASISKPEQIASLLHSIVPNMESLEFGPVRLPEADALQIGTDEDIAEKIAETQVELVRIKNARAVNQLLKKLRNGKSHKRAR
ncbi:hypothetical protein CALCODRAFT_500352 [Calocera cornea HHB12733]|uniref:F-box domain-containing protein n=1 Tax=Calocera cornea HHB12733 TaxID=1353952 RepID=A0A165E3H2_9BASI|nr:hypothetical protein CALCODRAFT_500352 [Calocera cornea HHB12733]